MLNSLKNLSLAGDSQPNYVRFELEADDGEFRFPPTTHFIATVEDLTDMPDTAPKTSTVRMTMPERSRHKNHAYRALDSHLVV